MANPLVSRLQDIPVLRQVLLLLGVAGAIALGLTVFFWSQQPGYIPLYSGLDDKDEAEISEVLQVSGASFKIDAATGAILVPAAEVHAIRLKLAGQGLPQGSRAGIESIQGDQGFGVSQFVENARYQHALETELARTIGTLRAVKDARVHLALPKPSAFTRQREPASASVLISLYPGRALEGDQIAAVVHLVASSISDLAPERVTLIDQNGRLLTVPDPESDAALNAAQFDQVNRRQEELVRRIQNLLEPMAGPGRVSAQVAVDMDFAVTEEARETFVPDPTKLRSEQISEQTSSSNEARGIPGATSNTPPGPSTTDNSASGGTASRNATRNYELDRTVSHTRQPPGRVRRISVAVLVDHIPDTAASAAAGEEKNIPKMRALSEDELKRVEALVKEVVGFDSARGDSVAVMNAPFVRPEAEQPLAGLPLWEQPVVKDGARLLLGGIVVLVLLLGVLRPALRQLVADKTPPLLEAQVVSSPLLAANPQQSILNVDRGYGDKLVMARSTVGQDPQRVAQVVKSWVGNES